MSKLSFLFLICSILYVAGCQNQKKEPARDTSMESLFRSYVDSVENEPRRAIFLIRNTLQNITDSTIYYVLSGLLSKAYYNINKIDSALLINQQTISFYENQPFSSKLIQYKVSAYNNMGILFQQINQRDSAIRYFRKSCQILEKTTNKPLLARFYINLADCYFQNGNYTSSSTYYRKALSIADALNEGRYYYTSYAGLARLYGELENFDLAEEFFIKAEKYWDNASDYEKFFFLNSRGNLYHAKHNYEKAIECYQQADDIIKSIPGANRIITQGNLAEMYILKGKTDSAHYFLNKAQDLLDNSSPHTSLKYYFQGLHASLALLENNIPKAEKILLQPQNTSAISPQYINSRYRILQELYLKKNDYKNAYEYYIKAAEYNDSLQNMKIHNNIAEIDSRYRQDTILIRKDALLNIEKSKASQWQSIAVLSIVLLILLLILILVVILYSRKTREIKYQKQLTMITGLRMEIVRNRLSPHFVFNTLNAIIPTLEQYNELEQPFRLLIQLLRNNLQISEHIDIPIEKEITLVKQYLQLYSLRDESFPHIEWNISPNISAEIHIPSMSIQIPVENAIKYAFTEKDENSQIQIKIVLIEKKAIEITIKDNGRGYDPVSNINDNRGTGNGLKMLYRTIEILNTRNDEKIKFKIENIHQLEPDQRGTLVTLIVPLNYSFRL